MVTGDFHSPCRTLVPEINNHNKRWNGKLKAGVIKVAAWSCSDLENLSFDAYTDAWKCLNKPCMKHNEMKCFLNKATPKILAISVSRYHVTSTISSGFSLNVLLVPSMSVSPSSTIVACRFGSFSFYSLGTGRTVGAL